MRVRRESHGPSWRVAGELPAVLALVVGNGLWRLPAEGFTPGEAAKGKAVKRGEWTAVGSCRDCDCDHDRDTTPAPTT
ncbi:hypothetical protein ACRAKI_02230 [Saccharothrix isguenensis]